jgi:hypothetical protein
MGGNNLLRDKLPNFPFNFSQKEIVVLTYIRLSDCGLGSATCGIIF